LQRVYGTLLITQITPSDPPPLIVSFPPADTPDPTPPIWARRTAERPFSRFDKAFGGSMMGHWNWWDWELPDSF
jgi:hypothetical protein